MLLRITEEVKRKAKLWRDWEINMLNMQISKFHIILIRRYGVKNLAAYNNINKHIDWLTSIIRGQVKFLKI